MNLAEKIITLRTNNNMSQGDLAEKLNVSRQSVSKWETGASIPDLEKLIAMSELFHITLDELVKGELSDTCDNTDCLAHTFPRQDEPTPQVIYVQTPVENTGVSSTQRIVGFILLVTGIICILLELFSNADGLLAILGAYLILCSIFCLAIKKNAGLKIAWMTALFLLMITLAYGWAAPIGTTRGIITLGTWIFILILTIVTIAKKRRRK